MSLELQPAVNMSSISGNDTSGVSRTLSIIMAVVTPILALFYTCGLYIIYRYGLRHPKPLNKASGVRLQRYGPVVYVFMVYSGLTEIALATWLLVQYRLHDNCPNFGACSGIRTILSCGCWTTVTAGTYTILFLHPRWSRHTVASIGAQTVWIFVTWIFWVSGTAVTNGSLPSLLTGGSCVGLVYCGQIQTLFALAVLEIFALTVGMLIIIWLAWQSTRGIIRPSPQKHGLDTIPL